MKTDEVAEVWEEFRVAKGFNVEVYFSYIFIWIQTEN